MAETIKTDDKNDAPRKGGWGKKLLWLALGLVALLIIAIIILRLLVTTSMGHRFIEGQLNDRNLGPIERVQIDEMSGDLFGEFGISSVKVFDKAGLWLTAEDVQIDWSPLAILSNNLNFNDVAIKHVEVIRQPTLNESAPGGKLPNISAPEITIERLALGEALAGQPAAFSVEAGATMTEVLKSLKLNLERNDTAGDSLKLDVSQEKTGVIKGKFSLLGVADGPISTLVRAPSGTAVSGEGDILGTVDGGRGNIKLAFGESEVVSAAGEWTASGLQINAKANVSALPAAAEYKNVLGETLSLEAELARDRAPREFTAKVSAENFNVLLSGALPEDGFRPDAADINLEIENPERLAALPDGFALGRLSLTGRAVQNPAMGFTGRVAVAKINSPYGKLSSVEGPVSVSMPNDQPISFKVDLDGKGLVLSQEAPVELANTVTLSANARYASDAKRFELTKASIASGKTKVSAAGRADMTSESFDFSGAVDVAVLERGSVPAGLLAADYTVKKIANSAPALSTNGQFTPTLAMQGPLAELFGDKLVFDTAMTPVEGGVKIDNAALSGAKIKAVLEGLITDTLDISLEAHTLEGFTLSSVEVGERTDVTVRVTGSHSDPNIKLQAEASAFSVGGQKVTDVTFKAEVTDILSAPKGPVQLTAATEYGELLASAEFASAGKDLTAADITLALGELTASGDMSYRASGLLDGMIKLDLPQNDDSFARAELTLLPGDGDIQNIDFEADAENIAYKDFAFDSLSAKAVGTLDSLSGDIALKGRRDVGVLSRPITLAAPFSLARSEAEGVLLQTKPEGAYGNIEFGAQDFLRLKYDAPSVSFNAPLLLKGTPVNIAYARSGTGEEKLTVKADDLPIRLIPLPGALADSRGSWGTDIDLTATSGVPSGNFNLSVQDWRGFGGETGTGLTSAIKGVFSSSEISATIKGQSEAGFTMSSDLKARLKTGDSLLSLRPDMDAPFAGQFTASGAAQTVLGLATSSAEEISGELNMNVQLAGTLASPRVNGQASGQALNFEAEQLGTQIKNGRFSTRFDNETLSVSDVFFNDAREGSASGSGKFVLGEFGRPIGEVNITTERFYIVDRRDVSARVSGNVKYESLPKSAAISGDIKIGEAEVAQFAAGGKVSVIEIEVEEINSPEERQTGTDAAPVLPTNLNITVKAPRKIFVRSKGLDVELSADLKIGGTTAEPLIIGRADVERGGYKIAGKTLEFESGSVIFNGPIMSALIALEAEAETTNLTATVKISGTIEDPKIDLSSSPERPDDEILSALLFGRSATELSAIEAAQLAGALAQFSGNGTGFNLLGGLRDSLGIGQLSVGVAEDGSAQVTGGRYLAKNVYLQVFSGAGDSQSGAVIDWELRRNLSLRSRLAQDNDQSLLLRYKKDF